MVIAPCSMGSLSAIAHGLGNNLIHRAADVMLKERRKLVLVVRESPLNETHLENMLKLSRMGVVILPPVPAFYNHPQNLEDLINHTTMRILDQFDIHLDVMNRWDGVMLSEGQDLEKESDKEPRKLPGGIGGALFGVSPLPHLDYGRNGFTGSVAYVF